MPACSGAFISALTRSPERSRGTASLPMFRTMPSGRNATARSSRAIERAACASNQALLAQLFLEVGIKNGRGDQAGDTKSRFHHQHGDQQFPGTRVDVRADDARIEEILELVDHDQENERGNRHGYTLAQADDDK